MFRGLCVSAWQQDNSKGCLRITTETIRRVTSKKNLHFGDYSDHVADARDFIINFFSSAGAGYSSSSSGGGYGVGGGNGSGGGGGVSSSSSSSSSSSNSSATTTCQRDMKRRLADLDLTNQRSISVQHIRAFWRENNNAEIM